MATELSEKSLGEGLGPSLLTHFYCTTHSVYSLLLSRVHGIANGAAPSGHLLGAFQSFSRGCQREFLQFWTVVFAFVLIRCAQESLGLTDVVTTVSVPRWWFCGDKFAFAKLSMTLRIFYMLFNLSCSFCELSIHFLCSIFYWVLRNPFYLGNNLSQILIMISKEFKQPSQVCGFMFRTSRF